MKMKGISTGLFIGLLSTALLAQPALASTNVFIDNDSTTYTTTSDMVTTNSPAFTYRTVSSDKNGDSRISVFTDDKGYFYHWEFPTGSSIPTTYNLSVYLNDTSFTNKSAQYSFGVSTIGSINQYSALAGNNWIGSGTDWDTIHVKVESYDYASAHPAGTKTGADQINIWN